MGRADAHTRLSYAAAWVRGRSDLRPEVGVVLGSGLSGVADRLEGAVAIPFEEIPEFPVATVEGHAGRLVLGPDGTHCQHHSGEEQGANPPFRHGRSS